MVTSKCYMYIILQFLPKCLLFRVLRHTPVHTTWCSFPTKFGIVTLYLKGDILRVERPNHRGGVHGATFQRSLYTRSSHLTQSYQIWHDNSPRGGKLGINRPTAKNLPQKDHRSPLCEVRAPSPLVGFFLLSLFHHSWTDDEVATSIGGSREGPGTCPRHYSEATSTRVFEYSNEYSV